MMMFIVLLLLLACFHGLSAFQWTSAYQNTTKICPGRNLTLGWDYSLEPGETVEDIKWLFTSSSNQTPSVIASYTSGFFCSDPSYDNRLTHLSDGKVVLASQTLADAGTYAVEVVTKQATEFSAIRRNLVVSVADPSTYSINVLTVKMDDQAVPGEDGKFHVRLTCGPLASLGEPPVDDVMWTTPSGAKLNSTGYENDYFYLMLDNPVLNGVYACSLPASAIRALCLLAGDPLARLTTVMVDSTSARFALLEPNFQHLKGENFHLKQQLQDVKKDNFNLTQQLEDRTQRLEDLTQQLEDRTQQLEDRTQQVEDRTQQLEDRTQRVEDRTQQLEDRTQQLEDRTQRVEDRTQQLEDRTQQLEDIKGVLTHQLQQVRTKQNQCRVEVGNNTRRMKLLEDDFSQYRNISSTHIGFHARLGHDITINGGDPVKFSLIVYNDGGAYNSTTGQFTAPVGGSYFFIFTTSPEGSEKFSSCQLMVGGSYVARFYNKYSNYYDYATGHVVLHVGKGTTVWVESYGNGYVFDYWSSFSGFLIRADL